MVHLERFEMLYTHTHTHMNTCHWGKRIFLYLPFIDTHAHNNLPASIIVCVCQRDRADSRVSDTPPPRWLFPVASCPLPVYCSGMFQNAGPVKPSEHLALHVCTINRLVLVQQTQWTMDIDMLCQVLGDAFYYWLRQQKAHKRIQWSMKYLWRWRWLIPA